MAWARLDDGFHAHPKVRATSRSALGLLALALSYSADYLTDGHIGSSFVSDHIRGRAAKREATELCERGFWEVTDEGYRIIDYLDYNPSRAQVEDRRKAERDKKARARSSRRDSPGLSPSGTPGWGSTTTSPSSDQRGGPGGNGTRRRPASRTEEQERNVTRLLDRAAELKAQGL